MAFRPKEGETLEVTSAYSEHTTDEGYLVLKPGQAVQVNYVGTEGDEVDFGYGIEQGSGLEGWFRLTALMPKPSPSQASREDPPRKEPPPRKEAWYLQTAAPPPPPAPPPPGSLWPQDVRATPMAPPPPRKAELLFPGNPEIKAPSADEVRAVEQGLQRGSHLSMHGKCQDMQQLVEKNRVVVVDAATGSGKSTMIPLCLVQQCQSRGLGCRIVVTQPRKLAAKGLARHVSQLAGTKVGDLVGYRVGGDRRDWGARVLYVTVGHLLEAVVHNPKYLDSFTHIVLDEVHERFVEADFLMAFLRMALSRPETQRQRLVVMSAKFQKRQVADFFRPVRLPNPEQAMSADSATIRLEGGSPFPIEDYVLNDIYNRYRGVIGHGYKEPDFSVVMPSRRRDMPERRWSDKLTQVCKSLTKLAARLICYLYREHEDQLNNPQAVPVQGQYASSCVVLVFLPGMDQMSELARHLENEYWNLRDSLRLPDKAPSILLMHSALEESRYRKALDPPEENEWKVVLATNIAESSLTVPGVKTVIDFAMHRQNIYDDEVRMSYLVTTWCSQASLVQRKGRTGRTNPGKYICFVTSNLYQELQDFDKSGVQRSSLTKVALQAAHLADQLSVEKVRAGLPVCRKGAERTSRQDIVTYFDGGQGLWRVSGTDGFYATREEDLELLPLKISNVLWLLPDPPGDTRIEYAKQELQDMGLLTLAGDRPTTLGVACLKLPIDVPLARLAVLAWVCDLGVHGAILASALSLSQCDLMSSPYNHLTELYEKDLQILKQGVDARRELDEGRLSEPLILHSLCRDWLLEDDCELGRAPSKAFQQRKNISIHDRLWSQFSTKLVELLQSMSRFLPRSDSQRDRIQTIHDEASGSSGGHGKDAVGRALQMDSALLDDRLLALLTFAMAPTGFLAVGQSPGIYDLGDSYKHFRKTVKEKNANEAAALWWPAVPDKGGATRGMASRNVDAIAGAAKCMKPLWTEEYAPGSKVEATTVCFWSDPTSSRSAEMPADAQLLYRICGPYRGKQTTIKTSTSEVVVVPPEHPGSYNWYMPLRNGDGLREVGVNWKAPAFSLIHPEQPGTRKKLGKCRPKRFLVASGAEYHTEKGKREFLMRGTSVLPDTKGGRKALMWLLASGMPLEAEMVALAAPTVQQNEFEVRGLWMWKRAFRFPDDALMSASDLRNVNEFRKALFELQRSKPHRLAGEWTERKQQKDGNARKYFIECLDPNSEPSSLDTSREISDNEEVLYIRSEKGKGVTLRGAAGGSRWMATDSVYVDESQDGRLKWQSGVVWERGTTDDVETPLLEVCSKQRVSAVSEAAWNLVKASNKRGRPRSPFPQRLVPLMSTCAAGHRHPLMPLDLDMVDSLIVKFKKIADEEGSDDFWSEEEDNTMDDDDDDRSLEQINEEFMWDLAYREDFKPDVALRLVENALAFPTATVCCVCDLEGKEFSKQQLRRPPGKRTCKECIDKQQNKSYLPPEKEIKKKFAGPMSQPPALAAANATATKKCSTCGIAVTAINCSGSQLIKPASKRKCNNCIASGR
ncbi:spn-E [Symbiodinium sp. CCMP2456]|nr:spn-E [Symbiodinium sp. CCMP2456]